MLQSWIRTLNQVRNVSAHHSRLWNRVSTDLPKSARTGTVPHLDHLFADRHSLNRVYAAAAITQHLMGIVSPTSRLRTRFKDLIATFPDGPGIKLRQAGFPANWGSPQGLFANTRQIGQT